MNVLCSDLLRHSHPNQNCMEQTTWSVSYTTAALDIRFHITKKGRGCDIKGTNVCQEMK